MLLFLVQTVGRQSVEQRQYRAARPRSASASSRKTPSSDLGMSIKIYLCTHQSQREYVYQATCLLLGHTSNQCVMRSADCLWSIGAVCSCFDGDVSSVLQVNVVV